MDSNEGDYPVESKVRQTVNRPGPPWSLTIKAALSSGEGTAVQGSARPSASGVPRAHEGPTPRIHRNRLEATPRESEASSSDL